MPDPAKEPVASKALASTRKRIAEVLFLHLGIETHEGRVMICHEGVPLREIEGLTPELLQQEAIPDFAHLTLVIAAAYRQTIGCLFIQIEKQHCAGVTETRDNSIDGHVVQLPAESPQAIKHCVRAATQLAIEDMKAYLDGVLEDVKFFQILTD